MQNRVSLIPALGSCRSVQSCQDHVKRAAWRHTKHHKLYKTSTEKVTAKEKPITLLQNSTNQDKTKDGSVSCWS